MSEYQRADVMNREYLIAEVDGPTRRIIAHCPTEADRDLILERLLAHEGLVREVRRLRTENEVLTERQHKLLSEWYASRGQVLASLHPLIRLKRRVQGEPFLDFALQRATTQAEPGVHVATLNPNGAVSVTATNGQELGIMPEEFEYLTPHEIRAMLAYLSRDNDAQ